VLKSSVVFLLWSPEYIFKRSLCFVLTEEACYLLSALISSQSKAQAVKSFRRVLAPNCSSFFYHAWCLNTTCIIFSTTFLHRMPLYCQDRIKAVEDLPVDLQNRIFKNYCWPRFPSGNVDSSREWKYAGSWNPSLHDGRNRSSHVVLQTSRHLRLNFGAKGFQVLAPQSKLDVLTLTA